MSIAKNLKTERERSGATQEELAAKTGLSLSTINKAENNLRWNPRIETVEVIREALECSLSDLLKRKAG